MERQRDGWKDGRTDFLKFPPVFYRTSSPSGPLPKNEQDGIGWGADIKRGRLI